MYIAPPKLADAQESNWTSVNVTIVCDASYPYPVVSVTFKYTAPPLSAEQEVKEVEEIEREESGVITPSITDPFPAVSVR